ncbi:AP5B1 C-terminal domain-containing protein [Entamoeba marina]
MQQVDLFPKSVGEWMDELIGFSDENPLCDWNSIETTSKFLQCVWADNNETTALSTLSFYHERCLPIQLDSENHQFLTKLYEIFNKHRIDVLTGKVPTWCEGPTTPLNGIPTGGISLLQEITQIQTLIVCICGNTIPALFKFAGDLLRIMYISLKKFIRLNKTNSPALLLYSVVLTNSLLDDQQSKEQNDYPLYKPMSSFNQQITTTSFASQSDNNPSQIKLFTPPMLDNSIPQFFNTLPQQVTESSTEVNQRIAIIIDNYQHALYWDILHLSTIFPFLLRCSLISADATYITQYQPLTNCYDPAMLLSLLHVTNSIQPNDKYQRLRYSLVPRFIEISTHSLLGQEIRACAISSLISLAESDKMVGSVLSPYAKQFFIPNITDSNVLFMCKLYGLNHCTNHTPQHIISFLPYILKNTTTNPSHYLYCGSLISLLEYDSDGYYDIVLEKLQTIVNSKTFFTFNSLPLTTCIFKLIKALLLSINKQRATSINKIIRTLIILKENSKDPIVKDWSLFYLRCIHHMSVQKMQKLLTHGNYPLVGTDGKLSLKTQDFLNVVGVNKLADVGVDGYVVMDSKHLQTLLTDDIESSTDKDSFLHCLGSTEEAIRVNTKDFITMVDGIAGQNGVVRIDIKKLKGIINKDQNDEIEKKNKDERGEAMILIEKLPSQILSSITIDGTINDDLESYLTSFNKTESKLNIPMRLVVQSSHKEDDEFYVLPLTFQFQTDFKTTQTKQIKCTHPLLRRSGDTSCNNISIDVPITTPHPCLFSVDQSVVVADSNAQLCHLSLIPNGLSLHFEDFMTLPPHLDIMKQQGSALTLFDTLWNKLAYKANVPLDIPFKELMNAVVNSYFNEAIVKTEEEELRLFFVLAPHSFLLLKMVPTQINSISLVEIVTDYMDALTHVNADFFFKHLKLISE